MCLAQFEVGCSRRQLDPSAFALGAFVIDVARLALCVAILISHCKSDLDLAECHRRAYVSSPSPLDCSFGHPCAHDQRHIVAHIACCARQAPTTYAAIDVQSRGHGYRFRLLPLLHSLPIHRVHPGRLPAVLGTIHSVGPAQLQASPSTCPALPKDPMHIGSEPNAPRSMPPPRLSQSDPADHFLRGLAAGTSSGIPGSSGGPCRTLGC